MNNGRKPFDDIRRAPGASSHAVDRKAIIDGAMFGYRHADRHRTSRRSDPGYVDLTGDVPLRPGEGEGAAEGGRLRRRFKADADAAAAGLCAPRRRDHRRRSCKAVGIEVEIVPIEWAQWLTEVFKGKNYDLTIISPRRAARHRYLRPRRLLLRLQATRPTRRSIAELNRDRRPGQAHWSCYGKAQQHARRRRRQRLPVPAAKSGVWNAKLKGLWENAPIQANDLTEVIWDGTDRPASAAALAGALTGLPAASWRPVLASCLGLAADAARGQRRRFRRAGGAARRPGRGDARHSTRGPTRWRRCAHSSASMAGRPNATSPGSAACCSGDFGRQLHLLARRSPS